MLLPQHKYSKSSNLSVPYFIMFDNKSLDISSIANLIELSSIFVLICKNNIKFFKFVDTFCNTNIQLYTSPESIKCSNLYLLIELYVFATISNNLFILLR